MLVLPRKQNQKIMIGDELQIVVDEFSAGGVRLHVNKNGDTILHFNGRRGSCFEIPRENIKVAIVEVRHSCIVRIGIKAPREIPVDREENYLEKKEERKNRGVGNSANNMPVNGEWFEGFDCDTTATGRSW